jgi:putative photosynthetic complex assembly protein
MLEHDYEPAPGLPQTLPQGEEVLWKGGSESGSLARNTFHVRKLALYFGLLLALRLAFKLNDGATLASALSGVAVLAILAAVALGLITGYASLMARSAMFTITNRRIVLRCGVAVPLTVNLPFSRIEAVDVREHGDRSGEIALLPERRSRVSYVLLWPMVKPWRFLRVRPVLRGIPDVAAVAGVLVEALGVDAVRTDADAVVAGERAQDAARNETDDDAHAAGWRTWLTYPKLPLAAASSLVVISLVAVTWLRLSDNAMDAGAAGTTEPVVATVDLYFEDRDDGSVAVIDAADGNVIALLEPGTNGFIRGALRSFTRARRAIDAGPEVPFSLQRTETGRLLLSDDVTGQSIDLRAFGSTNAEAFGRFLYDRAETARAAESINDHADGADIAAVAATNQESRQ